MDFNLCCTPGLSPLLSFESSQMRQKISRRFSPLFAGEVVDDAAAVAISNEQD
jgi:hypothetical protein